jgi:hypothetical protein
LNSVRRVGLRGQLVGAERGGALCPDESVCRLQNRIAMARAGERAPIPKFFHGFTLDAH